MTFPAIPAYSFSDGDSDRGLPSYAIALVNAESDALTDELAALGFSGWVTPREGRWSVAVAEHPLGHVASRRRTMAETGAAVARDLGTAVVVVTVRREHLLLVQGYDGDAQVVDYLSDATVARPDDDEAWGAEGVDGAEALVRLCGHDVPEEAEPVIRTVSGRRSGGPTIVETLTELLADDHSEDETESERVIALARLLGWPSWLVSVVGLPRRLVSGPDLDSLVRLRAGRRGVAGVVRSRAARVVRRKET